MLDRISIGWVWLEQHLNRIIAEVNQQKPIASSTIAIEESPNGTLLKVIPIQQTPPGPSSHGGAAKPTPVVWKGVGWVTVTIVDPITCAQSSLNVLAQKPNSSITIQ